ncbi:hypothetical protein GCO27_04225 [Corynebacterium sp. zg331]|nr:hypothetical protein [Corynebacterium sp. zg331]
MIVGDEHLELMVDAKGQVMETKRERETDLDDLNEARNATVSAEEAIREALNQHPDGVLDGISLDEKDGSLRWEIDLDDAQGHDLAEFKIPAA